MLVLFDQGTPVPIAEFLFGHSVKTAKQLNWDKLGNGELLNAAEETGFDVLLTTDKNLAYQQNLKGRKIAIRGFGSKQVEYRKGGHTANRRCGECCPSG